MKKPLTMLFIAALCLQAGCTLAPEYKRPSAPVAAEWPSGEAYKKDYPGDLPAAAGLSWREFFMDERLQKLIETALANNRDLMLASLNVERARAMYSIQRAELLPTVDASATGAKERIPADLSTTRKATTNERYDVNLGVASWELDFFGRLRSLKKQALEEYLASEEAQRAARVSLVSAVAQAYLTLAADREALKTAQETYDTQLAAYELIRKRFDVGVANELDLRRAEVLMDSARADVALYTQQAALDENALNLLLGKPAPGDLIPAGLAGVRPPREVSPGMRSEVLLSRPDILQAEHLLKGAYANIGAARAAFFPRITLTGMGGTASSELSGLFESGSRAWAFSPAVTAPIFDARIWPALKVSKVDRDMAVVTYERTVQTAFKETADVLAVLGTVQNQLSAQESLVKALSETCRLAESRYDKGIDSYLSVLDARRSLYSAQQGLVLIRLADLASKTRLYSVLGGGAE
jgi:multidrug efflux system outer membrane protein